jgi:Holliday junction DNA helicase RuvA
MIVGIRGTLVKATPLSAVIEAGGLHYEVSIPLTTAERMPNVKSEVFLHTLAVYREDSQSLYGFATMADRDFFKTLVEKVSGIGPKIAINIMSRMSSATLQSAIENGDVSLLSKCPGIGKKTAERLIVELRGAFKNIAADAASPQGGQVSSPASDAVSALIALGYKPADADKAARGAISKLGESASTEEIIRQALRG